MNINKLKILPYFVVLVLFTLVPFKGIPDDRLPSYLNSEDPSYKIKTIVIDPGHGGNKPGAVGKKSKEKDVVLDVSLKLSKAIEAAFPDVKVYLTRSTDVDVDIYKRTRFANEKKADLFISIHLNAAPYKQVKRGNRWVNVVNTEPHGIETYVLGFNNLGSQDAALRENADILLEENYEENYQGFDPNDPESYIIFSLMKNQYREQSIKLATAVQNQLLTSGRHDRKVKESKLAVLMNAGMPAILAELGFISNPKEEDYMLSDVGQEEMVKNLLDAIIAYKRQTER
jgi:N-acetylmuramoyl-L-alanine amidase